MRRLTGAYAAVAVADTVLAATGHERERRLSKPLLMPVLMAGRSGLLRRRPVLATPYVLAWAGLNVYLWPRTGRDRWPVVAYSTALLATALAALDTGDARTATGGALFLTSDALLALERFAGVRLPAHEGSVMASYTTAQGLLAAPRLRA